MVIRPRFIPLTLIINHSSHDTHTSPLTYVCVCDAYIYENKQAKASCNHAEGITSALVQPSGCF